MRKYGWRFTIMGVTFLASLGILGAHQEEFQSGPQEGKNLPGSFQPYNLNGRKGRDRLHCLVCEFQLNPVVLVFVREGKQKEHKILTELVKKIEAKVKKYRKTNFLSSFVVFLTPDAKSSATEAKIVNPDKLIEESQNRQKLEERLHKQFGEIMGPQFPDSLAILIGEPSFDWVNEQVADRHPVVVTYMADGPKDYKVSPLPGVTVVLYQKLKVEKVYAFPEGKFNEEAVAQVLTGVDVMIKGVPAKKK